MSQELVQVGRPVRFALETLLNLNTRINLAFAQQLLEHGANVLLADITLRWEAEALLSKYTDKPKAIFHKTDVVSWRDLNDMFAAAKQHFGAFDIVCPGAGVWEPEWSNFWVPPGTGASRDDPLGGRYASIDINLTYPFASLSWLLRIFFQCHLRLLLRIPNQLSL